MNTPADPLREALEAAIFVLEKVRVFVTSREQINAPTGVKWFDEEVELCRAALAAKPAEPDYWPSAKVTVHEDEVSYGVHRLTIELYAPGLPPGVYAMYLPGHPTESAAKPAISMQSRFCAAGICNAGDHHVEGCSEWTAAERAPTPVDPLRERLTAYLADAIEYKREWVPVSLQTLRAIIAALNAGQAASAPR